MACGTELGFCNSFELVELLARKGANVAKHKQQLIDVFGDEKADEILKVDALIGELSSNIPYVEKGKENDEGIA